MHTRNRFLAFGLAATLATVGLAACGEDDGGEVRSADGSSGSVSGSASGSVSGSASGPAGCEAVGTDLEGDAVETVEVTLEDFAFDPSTVSVAAGVVTFATTNEGTQPHELAFLPGGGDVPLTADGAPDEDALAAAGAFELEAYAPGGSCNATYELEAGTYTMFCIVEAEDGETHAEKGMVGELTVT